MSGLSIKTIQATAQNGAVFTRGMLYFQKKAVRGLRESNQGKSYSASVVGVEVYAVSISLDENDKPDGYFCDCPAYKGFKNGACKHIVATLFAILEIDKPAIYAGEAVKTEPLANQISRKTDSNARMFLRFFSNLAQTENRVEEPENSPVSAIPLREYSLIPKLNIIAGRWINPIMYVEFSYGCERQYPLHDIGQFAEVLHRNNDEELSFGKFGDFNPTLTKFDPVSKKLMNWLERYYIEEIGRNQALQTFGANGAIQKDRVRLTPYWLNEFLQCLAGQPLEIVIAGNAMTVEITDELPKLNLTVNQVAGGIALGCSEETAAMRVLDVNYGYVLAENTVAKIPVDRIGIFETMINNFYLRSNRQIEIANNDVSIFLAEVLPVLSQVADVKVSQLILDNYCEYPLESKAYLANSGNFIECSLQFVYNNQEINPLATRDEVTIGGKILVRNKTAEAKSVNLLKRYGFYENNSLYLLVDEDKMLRFLEYGIAELNEFAEVYGDESLAKLRPRPPKTIRTAVSVGDGNLLELAIDYEDSEIAELLALLNALRQKKKYYRLKTGEFISLDSEELQQFADFLHGLNISAKSLASGKVSLAKRQALYLDSLANDRGGLSLERAGSFKKLICEVTSPQQLEYRIPEGINGTLREYQQTGFKWLKTLKNYGFGGILADDMGLGKTLQAITLMQYDVLENNSLPSLVVAPTSLIYNWQNEIAKFAPGLRTLVVAGTRAGRQELLRHIADYDTVITTYGLLRSDIQDYEDVVFGKCFIDEAQHIKNPSTLSAKAVKRIKAQGYFALTGTPIENSLTELWSIFDFLMPGYLGQHHDFVEKYEAPIVKENCTKALADLKIKVQPFIMRRLKKQVLKELPDKIESISINEMTKEQRKIYKAFMLHARRELDSEIQKNGFAKSQIAILTLLMRLRQICCHPGLFMDNFQGASGKLEQLSEILEDALSGGHRILLFSQFTSMHQIIKAKLQEQGLAFFYLDGSTPAKERMELVNRFNGGECSVFLISLKAGGTGLNLTGADVVIHYDPWWNPAVEDQATDRAHRIGQKNVVQVYKMITKDSIEEKIFELQQKKRRLIDAVIEPGETMLNKLTETEIRALFE
ncbi:MAG: DEAD/DEAH box helicase [Negativicutes bacterium]|jgi:superfamily II DNA or RNA helicase